MNSLWPAAALGRWAYRWFSFRSSSRPSFCDLIAPDLARLLPDLRRRHVELVLISRGEPDANGKLVQQFGMDSPTLLAKDGQVIEAFRGIGTPAAYLLNERGKVAKPLAIGTDQVLALAREVVLVKDGERLPILSNRDRLPRERPLSESHILRDGLKAGTPGPSLQLARYIRRNREAAARPPLSRNGLGKTSVGLFTFGFFWISSFQ